ncbi:tetratricopeptide repeat protein [Poseidonocella sp. HB161398]|uniref:tetratricopeptide repeat protein n=1 Tax=Poseidonocella sp. HB161398 TaxID=2320855 RepID=UPI001F0EF2D5|nr:tetratricopeptide repeat protein [Poseidonocella sp. HB161398]
MFRNRSRLFAAALCLGMAPAAVLGGNAGTYLAGRVAGMEADHARAAEYFTRALALDARNPGLMELALTAQVNLGDFDGAAAIMRRMQVLGLDANLMDIVELVDWMDSEDYAALREALGGGDFHLGDLLDGFLDQLVTGWAELGAGDGEAAIATFDEAAAEPMLRGVVLYHKALALAVSGDYEGAEALLSGASEGPLPLLGRGLRLRAEVQSQLGHYDQALQLLDEAYDGAVAPQMSDIVARLQAGEPVPLSIANARQGIAEAFYTMAQVLYGQAGNSLSLVYAQVARELNPDHVDALLMVASIFDEQANYDLAGDLYDKVPRDHPAYLQAEFGRANALRYAGRKDAAIEVLNQLSKTYPDLMDVQVSLGDALSSDERWEAARAAYDRAVALIEEPIQADWQLFYARGITLERLKLWPEAEADLRHALELSPDEPRVLNYLGYSLVERRESLDEALDMIRKASEQRPEDGYISDSLGWVYFRLGRYEEAVAPMESAAEIMAIDPVINDHLGDVYWAVGRKLEAQFMWRRALSFTDYGSSNEEVDPARIRRKLEVGLDKVLAEEGAEPLGTNSEGN